MTLRRRLALPVLAIAVWRLSGSAHAHHLIGIYLGLTLLLGMALRKWPAVQERLFAGSAFWTWSFLCLVLILKPLVSTPPDGLSASKLEGIWINRINRLFFESKPSIFPRIIRSDHPQRFYIHAPETKRCMLRIANASIHLEAINLSEGLFSLDFNPNQFKNEIQAVQPGEIRIQLDCDGRVHERSMRWIRPLAHPRWIDSDPSAGIGICVSEETDEVYILDRQGKVTRYQTDDGPVDARLFKRNGRFHALIVHRYTDNCAILDLESGLITGRIGLQAEQTRCVISPDDLKAAVATLHPEKEIQILNLAAERAEASINLSFYPDWLAFGEDDKKIVFTSRTQKSLHLAVEAPTWHIPPGFKGISLGRPATSLCRGRDGKSVYIANTGWPMEALDKGGNHFVQHHIVRISIEDGEILSNWVTDRRTQMQSAAGSLDSGISPMGLSLAEKEGLWISFAGSDECWFAAEDLNGTYRRFNLERTPLKAPHGIADLGSDVVAVASPSQGIIGFIRTESENPQMLFRETAIQNNALKDQAWSTYKERLGEQSFYETTQAGVSCQSCHLHGDSDYSLHNLGPGLLHGTLSSRGTAFTEPFLRDGSFPTMQALHSINEGIYRGYRKPFPEDRGDMLKAFVESLSFEPNPRWPRPRDLDRERSGVQAFVKANCVECHSFPAFTNLGQHPIHLLFPSYKREIKRIYLYDTPSLRGLWNSAPYLYDGRSESLRKMLARDNPDKQHGDVSLLTEVELESLVSFLETL